MNVKLFAGLLTVLALGAIPFVTAETKTGKSDLTPEQQQQLEGIHKAVFDGLGGRTPEEFLEDIEMKRLFADPEELATDPDLALAEDREAFLRAREEEKKIAWEILPRMIQELDATGAPHEAELLSTLKEEMNRLEEELLHDIVDAVESSESVD